MIYDCFLFWKELDVLDIRLHELSGIVDRFVLVEAPCTFSGRPKPLHFANARDRFADLAERIVHVVADDLPSGTGPWEREHHQRNCILRGLVGCSSSDVILVSDVDEIPAAQLVALHAGYPGITTFRHQLYYYFLNCQANDTYRGTRMLPYRLLQDGVKPQQLRDRDAMAGIPQQVLAHAGWHFSYLGGAEAIREKIGAYSHTELNRPPYTSLSHIDACMRRGRDLFGRDSELQFTFVGLDSSYPRYVQAHAERFAHLIHQGKPGAQRPRPS